MSTETMRVEEAAGLLGLSRAATYEAIKRGEIPAIRIGKRLLVLRSGVERILAGPTEGSPEERRP